MDKIGNIILYNDDCMEIMKEYPDRYFDLAIVDPPYGINVTKMNMESGIGLSPDRTEKRLRDKRLKGAGKLKNRIINQMNCDWDLHVPNKQYFEQLFRISKNQIIWGGNYFELKPTRCFVIWDKEQSFLNFSACEYAWTSFDYPSKLFRFSNRGILAKDKSTKIHPTQKPVNLYKYLLYQFAKNGDKIIDTHLGSGSSALAAADFDCEFVGCEIDNEYYDGALNRIRKHIMQQKITFNE